MKIGHKTTNRQMSSDQWLTVNNEILHLIGLIITVFMTSIYYARSWGCGSTPKSSQCPSVWARSARRNSTAPLSSPPHYRPASASVSTGLVSLVGAVALDLPRLRRQSSSPRLARRTVCRSVWLRWWLCVAALLARRSRSLTVSLVS